MLDLVFWLLFGGLSGWIASIVMADSLKSGTLLYVLAGIGGALLGGLLIRLAGAVGVSGFNILSTLSAMFGSFVLVTIMRLVGIHKSSL